MPPLAMSLINKSKKEKEAAELFRNWYNNINNTDFKAIRDPDDRDIDYSLVSPSDKTKQLNLQITTCDHRVIKAHLEAMQKPGELISFESMHEQLISKAITDKLKYPPEVQEQLILLVWSDMARFNSDYIRRLTNETCAQTSFKEIYLLELPSDENNKSYPPKEGNVICLK